MLFKRRDKPVLTERVRVLLWPRNGWRRSTQYVLKRVLRLSGTPHAIALGVAAGVFASFTPLVGFHFVIGFIVAWVLGGNLIASALGTFVGNPLTFPLIWASTFQLGNWILGNESGMSPDLHLTKGLFSQSMDVILPIFVPMLISGVPMGILAGIVFYYPVRLAIDAYQNSRRDRLRNRLRQRSIARSQPPETSSP